MYPHQPTFPQRALRGALVVLCTISALSTAACGGDDPQDTSNVCFGVEEPATREGAALVAEELGINEFLCEARISETAFNEARNVTTYTFDPESGPLCLRGEAFRVSTRDSGSEDLIIFLQGGGACWSEFCLAVTRAPAGVPNANLLNPTLEANPLSDWNVVYLPYCDGSLFSGNNDLDDDGDGQNDRFHRGLQNLSASLDIARREFPSPRRVVLAGSSGGGFGTILGAPLVRHVYPDAELYVLNDSGVGVARGEDDPAFVQQLIEEFNVERFFPESCVGCTENGHITRFVDWYLERDPDIRVGAFTSWYDSIIANTFLKVDPADFRDNVDEELSRIQEAFPEQFRRFIIDGTTHTTLLGDVSGIVGSDLTAIELPPGFINEIGNVEIGSLTTTSIGDLTMSAWIGAMVNRDDENWVDITEVPGPVPGEDAPEPSE